MGVGAHATERTLPPCIFKKSFNEHFATYCTSGGMSLILVYIYIYVYMAVDIKQKKKKVATAASHIVFQAAIVRDFLKF